MSRFLALVLLVLAFPAIAAPPNPCEVLTSEDVSSITARPVDKVSHKPGNPAQCSYHAGSAVALVVSLKEAGHAPKDEFDLERASMEKVYRMRAKHNDTVGDGAFWLAGNKTFGFRKGKVYGFVKFEAARNQNEVDSAQVARLIEAKLK